MKIAIFAFLLGVAAVFAVKFFSIGAVSGFIIGILATIIVALASLWSYVLRNT